ncbi:sigma-54-dependent transcriptional regulator [Endothiovibrio diazotrophicus]
MESIENHGLDGPGLKLVSNSQFLRPELSETQRRIAMLEGPVLISGETGTGKTVLAQELHYHSSRADRSVLVKGCGEFVNSPGLIDSALFGHMKNAFTGAVSSRDGVLAVANGGTLILDDIDYLPIEGQQKLLRFLDDKKISRVGAEHDFQSSDIRLIVTTNKDLHCLIERGSFLRDLYYRLSTWRISLTPLRETPEKVRAFSEYFLAETLRENPSLNQDLEFAPETLALFESMSWWGNLRDLRNAVANVAVQGSMGKCSVITVNQAADILFDPALYPENSASLKDPKSRDAVMLKLLQLTGWNIRQVARIFGVSRTTIYAAIDRNGWKKK